MLETGLSLEAFIELSSSGSPCLYATETSQPPNLPPPPHDSLW